MVSYFEVHWKMADFSFSYPPTGDRVRCIVLDRQGIDSDSLNGFLEYIGHLAGCAREGRARLDKLPEARHAISIPSL
jgi:hypothetical protein